MSRPTLKDKLSILQKIDLVLKAIAQNSHPLNASPDISYRELYNILTERGFNNAYIIGEFKLIIAKLLRDGYVASRKGGETHIDTDGNKNTYVVHYYSVTFEGIVFIESGGYIGQNEERKKTSNAQRSLHQLQQQQTKMQRWIVILTFVLAGTAIPSALYYILEIIDWIGTPFCRFH